MTRESEPPSLTRSSPGSQPAKRTGTAEKLAVLREAVALAAAIVAFIASLIPEKLGGVAWTRFVRHLSTTVWLHVLIVAAIPILGGFCIAGVWRVVPLLRAAHLSTAVVLRRSVASAAVVAAVIGLISVFVGIRPQTDRDVALLFPQSVDLGGAFILTYASNGDAQYSVTRARDEYGPNGYARIDFRCYGNSERENAGWVIYFLRGADLSGFKYLRFLIRGERGRERIGVKAKDILGREMFVILDQRYLRGHSISNEWQEARIELSDFGDVHFGSFDNFSVFSNGELAQTRPQSIYVGEFVLQKSE
jgi:hypothetical protein